MKHLIETANPSGLATVPYDRIVLDSTENDVIVKGGVTYEYVDLGLPSGLKWAKCNVGAETETDYGYYFQWGDIVDKSNADCSWANYKYCNGSETTLTKYNNNTSYGENPDNKTTLESVDDAATQIMGGKWRMPTSDEIRELFDNTTNVWVTNYNGSGINGRKLTSKKNGNSIFFPASGRVDGTGVSLRGSDGSYWSSSLLTFFPNNGFYLYFSSDVVNPQHSYNRYYGFCVRSVCM